MVSSIVYIECNKEHSFTVGIKEVKSIEILDDKGVITFNDNTSKEVTNPYYWVKET